MSLAVINNQVEWNRFVLENGGGFLQSWEWGLFQEALGRRAYRYRVDSSQDGALKETVGQFLLIEHAMPFGRRYVYTPLGPVVAGAGYQRDAFRACAVTVVQAAQRLGAVFARIEPPALAGEQLTVQDVRRAGFRDAGQVQPRHTTIVDLTQDEEQLLKNMKQKTRYNIRLAQKKGVTVRSADLSNAHTYKEDVSRFWQLMTETTERDQFHAHEQSYYEKMLEVLSPRKQRDLKVQLLIAEYSGEPVAAALVAHFGDTATYLHGASSSRHKSVMAPYMLQWTAMQEAKQAGLRQYDFWGVAPEDAGDKHPWVGITRFKMGFGGQRVSYIGAWDYPTSKPWYGLYRLARRLR
jgi:lipid II:glycine glycyltransferase (peptidoglycan interpeptide bridge formation enzyme)